MICALESHEFVPYGRRLSASHPGRTVFKSSGQAATDHGLPIEKALRDFSLRDGESIDRWMLRGSGNPDQGCDEELYIQDRLVVWSRGKVGGSGHVIKTFSMDSAVQQALWCSFLLPINEPVSDQKEGPATMLAQVQQGVCIMEQSCINIFTTDGRDYSSSLPFVVSKMWTMKNGLLFERASPNTARPDPSKTPKKDQVSPTLPVLFSMLHPLEEVTPVICRMGGNNGKLSFVTENSQKIVYTSEETSLVVTYDCILGLHSAWTMRKAKTQEACMACSIGMDGTMASRSIAQPDFGLTPGGANSQSISGMSRFTPSSSQSPTCGTSPYQNLSSRINSPLTSRISSPSLSRLAISRTQSPSQSPFHSLLRLQTPSPGRRVSMGGLLRTPMSAAGSMAETETSYMEVTEALTPDMCLDYMWTEPGGMHRDGTLGAANKVFLTMDLCGQMYLCYFISCRYQLRCVKVDESNDGSQLIFGSLSILKVRDAEPLQSLKMMVVLDMSGNMVLYTGLNKINNIHVSGLSGSLSVSGPHLVPVQPSTPFGSPLRRSSGPVTSSRPPSALDARFDDEVNQLSPIRKGLAFDLSESEDQDGSFILHGHSVNRGSVPLLSPVPTELSDTSQPMLGSSFNEDLSFQPQHPSHSPSFTGLRDAVEDRFTLELSDGSLHRMSIPPVITSPTIQLCLEALQLVLPRDISLLLITRWYNAHNAPGSRNGQSSGQHFTRCLLGMLGYDVDQLPLTRQVKEFENSTSPVMAPKKPKPSDQGADEDWLYLCSSDTHRLVGHTTHPFPGLSPLPSQPAGSCGPALVDPTAPLFQYLPQMLLALHLVYEELKLDILSYQDHAFLAALLCQLARDLQCEQYADHYYRDLPFVAKQMHSQPLISTEHLQQLQLPSHFTVSPPSVCEWLLSLMTGTNSLQPYPFLPHVCIRTIHVIAMYVMLVHPNPDSWTSYLRKVSAAGRRTPDIEDLLNKPHEGTPEDSPRERVVLFMAQLDESVRESLPHGVLLPLREAVAQCCHQPPGSWPEEAYNLIGREDLARQCQVQALQSEPPVIPTKETMTSSKGIKEEEDGMEYLDQELLGLRFSEDLRVQEVRRLLQSSRPVKISIQQRPEVSDHEFIEEQERHLYAICIRTMALPIGRGMFTLSTYYPIPTETLPIPKLCLTGRAPPRNTTVDLTHIETPPNMSHWPQFHNGVAAGLRISKSVQIDHAWIIYNKPKMLDVPNEHAGFLMGLGLNGHLDSLAKFNVHDYLIKCHEMTSMALLLGISAGKRGSMDMATTKLLSIHVTALLPPTSTELNIAHNIQVAAILGVGLVYQGTAHRHIAEVLLQEIGRPPGPDMENCTDRESYSLAAGLALGLVMLGKNPEELGLPDLGMADQLYHYIAGGHKRPLTGAYKERYKSPSYQIKEGDSVNVDVTAPGAMLALGMMFFDSNNSAVAEWLTAPDTQFLLDFVKPDFLMLRVISRSLVLWESVHPSQLWLDSNLPEIVHKYAFGKMKYRDDPDCDIDFETMSQAYCNIMAGSCMAIGLKFAGSANEEAYNCLYFVVTKVLRLFSVPLLVEQAGRSTVETCFVVIVLSLAMVMAGTGHLEVLRLCRFLRTRIGQSYNYVLYGSHMAISMAIGLLFLGGGRYTLSTTPEAVAAMLIAFFPKFPIHCNDNRYHLQAFRHLYVLAAVPRVVIPKDVGTGHACYVLIKAVFKATEAYESFSYSAVAPCLLPQLELLQEVCIEGPRYWSVSFNSDKNWENLKQILNGSGYLYVKQRAGHLSYKDDPQGYHSVLAQSLTGEEQVLGKIVKTEDIKSFSSDPRILAFAEYFCNLEKGQDYGMVQFLSQMLYECVSQEKVDVLNTYINLHKGVAAEGDECAAAELWQLRLMETYYSHVGKRTDRSPLISQEFLTSLTTQVQGRLSHALTGACGQQLLGYLGGEEVQWGRTLAAYLTWYHIPHPTKLPAIPRGLPLSFPVLYSLLQPCGLSVASIISLASAVSVTS